MVFLNRLGYGDIWKNVTNETFHLSCLPESVS